MAQSYFFKLLVLHFGYQELIILGTTELLRQFKSDFRKKEGTAIYKPLQRKQDSGKKTN